MGSGGRYFHGLFVLYGYVAEWGDTYAAWLSITKFRIFPSKKEMYCNFLGKNAENTLFFYLEKCRKVGVFALEKCKFMLKTHYFHPFLTSITQSLQLNDSFR